MYYQNAINKTGSEYIYPLDDTYIHLSIARNVALYNNWGVGHDEFSSSSSSPLYTFIISLLIRMFGDNAIYPLLVNLFFGNLIIIALYMFIKSKLWFIAGAFFLCTPVLLHIQILSGMEHTMHIFIILTAFILISKFTDSEFNNRKYGILFLFVSALLCMSRYESMFFLVPVLIILLLNKRYVFTLLTFIAGFLPVLLFGIWSVNNGGFFFPNSLLLKGDIAVNMGISGILHYLGKVYRNIFNTPVFIGPVAVILIIIIHEIIHNKNYNFNAIIKLVKKYFHVYIVLTNILFHTLFAGFGWLFRYEAYLLLLLYLTMIIIIKANASIARSFIAVMSVIFIFHLLPAIAERGHNSHIVITQANKNIHDQQIQMSKFLKTYYNESNVMASDIGAITYYTSIKLKDLVGLGSNDIVVLRKENNGGGGGGGF
jgi:hypothetical protein